MLELLTGLFGSTQKASIVNFIVEKMNLIYFYRKNILKSI